MLDLGCGTGDLCDVVAAAGYSPIGVDFSAGMLAAAHTPAPLARADALALPVPDASTDGVVCGFALRNFVDLERFFRECARVLRPGARLAALEAAEPAGPLLRAGHNIWFRRVVPFVGATLAHDAEAYDYLPRSTAYLPPAGDLLALVEARRLRGRRAPHVHCGRRPADHGHTAMTATSIAAGLVARTREVEPPGDLLDSLSPDGFAWLTDGSGFVTSGVAARVRAGDVDRVLAGIESDDPVSRAGTGAIAVSSLPFRGAAQGELVIPASVTGLESDGRAWHTDIGSTVPFAPSVVPAPTRFSVEGRVLPERVGVPGARHPRGDRGR